MKQKRLDPEKWYDILIEPYLNAVKKYHEYESARQYTFATVLKNMLWTAVTRQLKQERALKRVPEDMLYSLDFTMQGDNPNAEYTSKVLEEFWIDHRQQPERVVMDKSLIDSIVENLNDVESVIFEMLLEGYNKKEISKELCMNYLTLKAQIEKLQKIVSGYLSM